MAVQTTSQTNTDQNEEVQTGGTRSFHSNDTRGTSPASQTDTGVESGNTKLPTGSGEGITNAGPSEERKQQEKVVDK